MNENNDKDDRPFAEDDIQDPESFPLERRGPERVPAAPSIHAIRQDGLYPLRDAAVLLGIPEGQLRRAVLLENLPAQEVCDDRHYLFSGTTLLAYARRPRPFEEVLERDRETAAWGLAILLLFPILAAVLLIIAELSAAG